jgi:hypothetical protein
LPATIALGWKGLPRTNTLAYYENAEMKAAIRFILRAPGQTSIKGFTKSGPLAVFLLVCDHPMNEL